MAKRLERSTQGHQTTDYVRGPRFWVKIIRDSKQRTFFFAQGYNGSMSGDFQRDIWTFSVIRTWAGAIEHAEQMMKDWE
jgi:hypothetical protein